MLHQNDAQLVRMWKQRNPNDVFYYSKICAFVARELNSQNMSFTLRIQTSWQHLMMAQYGHLGGVLVDATFETKDKKVLLISYHYLSQSMSMCSIPYF